MGQCCGKLDHADVAVGHAGSPRGDVKEGLQHPADKSAVCGEVPWKKHSAVGHELIAGDLLLEENGVEKKEGHAVEEYIARIDANDSPPKGPSPKQHPRSTSPTKLPPEALVSQKGGPASAVSFPGEESAATAKSPTSTGSNKDSEEGSDYVEEIEWSTEEEEEEPESSTQHMMQTPSKKEVTAEPHTPVLGLLSPNVPAKTPREKILAALGTSLPVSPGGAPKGSLSLSEVKARLAALTAASPTKPAATTPAARSLDFAFVPDRATSSTAAGEGKDGEENREENKMVLPESKAAEQMVEEAGAAVDSPACRQVYARTLSTLPSPKRLVGDEAGSGRSAAREAVMTRSQSARQEPEAIALTSEEMAALFGL